jgi:flagellar motor switch protein FliG
VTLNYLSYVMVIGLAALSVAAVCCAALWLLAPAIFERGLAGQTAPDGQRPAAPPRAAGGVRFDFTAAEAPALAALLGGEAPGDIALVLARLSGEAAAALLGALPAEVRAAAALALAEPRQADMALLRAMKDELENRIYGASGGPAAAAALLKALPYGERKAVLEKALAADAERGAALRALVPLDEDLLNLGEADFSALAAAVPPERMGPFIPALPDKLRARVRGGYEGRAAAALEKRVPDGPYGKKEAEAELGNFMELFERLAEKGIVARPRARAQAAPAKAAAAVKAKDDWG